MPDVAVPPKPDLPKKPRQPKQVKDAAENERRQADHRAALQSYEEAMSEHKKNMAVRESAQRAIRQRDPGDGARRMQQRRAGKAVNKELGPFTNVFRELVDLTNAFVDSCTPIPGKGCPERHAAEAALSQAWERLLGRKVPQTAAAGRRRQRFAVSFSSSSEGWIEGQQVRLFGAVRWRREHVCLRVCLSGSPTSTAAAHMGQV
jgi:hypothetical protein